MEKHANRHSQWLNYLFTAIIIAALIVVYLLTGRREQEAGAAAAAASPAAAQPTATPFGRRANALIDDLALSAIDVTAEKDGYLLQVEGADDAAAAGRLQLSLTDGFVSGFVLAFPAVSEPDADGSTIAAALEQRAAERRQVQAKAMEQALLGVLSAYDGEYALPVTVRSEWCALFLALQETKESAAADHGRFHFSVYPSGSGDAMRLCCAVRFE